MKTVNSDAGATKNKISRAEKCALLCAILWCGTTGWYFFMLTPEPYAMVPEQAWAWGSRSFDIERIGFFSALMPLWCMGIHRFTNDGLPGIRQFLTLYGVITALGLFTAWQIAQQLHAPDCLRTCPDGLPFIAAMMFFLMFLLIAAMFLSVLALLNQHQIR